MKLLSDVMEVDYSKEKHVSIYARHMCVAISICTVCACVSAAINLCSHYSPAQDVSNGMFQNIHICYQKILFQSSRPIFKSAKQKNTDQKMKGRYDNAHTDAT